MKFGISVCLVSIFLRNLLVTLELEDTCCGHEKDQTVFYLFKTSALHHSMNLFKCLIGLVLRYH